MSNPSDPTPPLPDSTSSAPGDGQPSAAADQPTEVFPAADSSPADSSPTVAFPPAADAPASASPADPQPTEAYPPAAEQPAYAPPAYAQPAYAPAAYGQAPDPAYGFASAEPAPPRPKTLGWLALGLAIGGLVLVGIAFIPLLWVSLVLALIGGLLLIVALVLGIVTLASKKQGGKGLGIGAIIVSVLGGGAWIGAITFALVFIGLSASGTSVGDVFVQDQSVTEEQAPGSDDAEGGTEDDGATGGETEGEAPAGTYDEAAYLAQVRPEITALMQEIEPSITEESLSEIYSDDDLVQMGSTLLAAGDASEDSFVSSLVDGTGGLFTAEMATRFYDSLVNGAQQHLVE